MIGLSVRIAMLCALLGVGSAVLAAPTTFECDYSSYSDEKGLHKVTEQFRLSFLIDAEAEKAYLIGNIGTSEVSLVPNDNGFTLVEITGTGNVMVTVISSKGKSVHSRSGILLGDIIPSQYYGMCRAK